MSTTTDQFTPTDIPRDGYGRALVVPPGGGKNRVPYRRVTTFVGALEDTYGLQLWKQRQVAIGMARRADLVLAAAAADPDDKERLNEIVGKATEHATAAATTGSSLHALTEQLDRGQKLGRVPAPYDRDLEAYRQATAGIEWLDIETFRVIDGWQVAGTADRIGRINGSLVVADIKTGSIDFPNKMAMQLACYARSLPYDIVTDRRGPAPRGLNLHYGIIVHLPAGEGRCQLYRVDLVKGWGACLIAKQVWDFRATKGLLEPLDENTCIAPSFVDQACTAATVEELTELWRAAKRQCALTKDFLVACEERHQQLVAST